MSQLTELRAEVERLRELLKEFGIEERPKAAKDVTERGDYIPFGSAKHAAFIGLIPVTEANPGPPGVLTYKSPRTGKDYRLEDQVTPFMTFPDPLQVAGLVLQQKVNELEIHPEVPPDAPPMFVPRDLMPELA